MTRLMQTSQSRAREQRGFTMLEILVTLFLLSMWLLASAGVQSSSLQFTKAAEFRTQAVYLATELAERMQANLGAAVAGSYQYAGGTTIGKDCTTATCLDNELADFDLAEWNGRVTAVLPNATVSVTTAGAANPITYTIVVSWTDRRDGRAYSTTGTTESFSYTATKTLFQPPS